MRTIAGYDVSGWFETGLTTRPLQLGRGSRRALVAIAKVAGLIGLTGLALGLAAALVPDQAMTRRDPENAADAWVEVNRPIEIFSLAGTDFVRLPHSYRARRHPADGGRRDTLAFGDPGSDTPFLGLSFYRLGRDPGEAPRFAEELDASVRDGGFVLQHAAAPTPLATRFGPFEAADVGLVYHGVRMPCLSFRSVPNTARPLRIAGLLCGGAGKPVARDGLGCVIDRIDLVSAGEDIALQRMFVEAERRRGPACAPSSLTAAGSRITWLDANASLPVLRGVSSTAMAKQ